MRDFSSWKKKLSVTKTRHCTCCDIVFYMSDCNLAMQEELLYKAMQEELQSNAHQREVRFCFIDSMIFPLKDVTTNEELGVPHCCMPYKCCNLY